MATKPMARSGRAHQSMQGAGDSRAVGTRPAAPMPAKAPAKPAAKAPPPFVKGAKPKVAG